MTGWLAGTLIASVGVLMVFAGIMLGMAAPWGGGLPMLAVAFFLVLFGGLAALAGVIMLVIGRVRTQ